MKAPRFPRRRGILWIGAAAVAAGLFFGGQALRSDPVPSLTLQTREAVETVLASGRIVGKITVPLSFVRPGRIAEEFIRDGEAVPAGLVLMRLDARHENRARDRARIILAEARLRKDKLRTTDLADAEEKVRQAGANDTYAGDYFKRQAELFNQNTITRLQYEQSRRDRALAASALSAAENQLKSLREIQTAQADLDIARAESDLKQAEIDLQDTVLKAPVSGRIVSHDAHSGEFVAAGQKVVTFIPDAARTFVEIQVDETQAGRLVPGQKAFVSSAAFPDRIFSGEVERIGAIVDAQRGSFTVRVKLDRFEADLLAESSVSVQIELGRASGILFLEQRFILRENGRTSVFIADGRRARRTPVIVRDLGNGLFECREGLRAGQTVLLPPGMKDGLKVRPVPLSE